MNYLFDFGTGAGRTFPHPFTWIEWIYAYPGTFIVTGVADSRYVGHTFFYEAVLTEFFTSLSRHVNHTKLKTLCVCKKIFCIT